MGSELIINILKNCNWLKKINNKHIILQPMKKPWILREYLFKNKFKIIDEKVVFSKNFFYVIIKAKYTYQIINYTPINIFTGTLLNNNNQVTKDYLNFLYKKFKCISQKILANNSDIKKYQYFKTISDQIKKFI